jgi:hypothetical protein
MIVTGQWKVESSNLFDSLKHEKERKKGVGGVVRDIMFNGRGTDKFTAINIPRQCPLVLWVKAAKIQGKAFGSGEGRQAKNGARTEAEAHLHSHCPKERTNTSLFQLVNAV